MLYPDQLSCATPQLVDTPQYLLLSGLWGPLGVVEVRGVQDPYFNKFGCLFGCFSLCDLDHITQGLSLHISFLICTICSHLSIMSFPCHSNESSNAFQSLSTMSGSLSGLVSPTLSLSVLWQLVTSNVLACSTEAGPHAPLPDSQDQLR